VTQAAPVIPASGCGGDCRRERTTGRSEPDGRNKPETGECAILNVPKRPAGPLDPAVTIRHNYLWILSTRAADTCSYGVGLFYVRGR